MSDTEIFDKMEFEADGYILEITNVFSGSKNKEGVLLEILENEIFPAD